MLQRKIENILGKWKCSEDKKPLVIKGCRQCGKTYSVRKFAKENYKREIYINFFQNPEYMNIFKGSLGVDDMLMKMSMYPSLSGNIIPGETIIILDEIQECPEARTSLKFWSIDGRFDVISTGSLLGIRGYKQPISVPVGYEEIVQMTPMDFEEFIWANGITEEICEKMRKYVFDTCPIETAIHNRMRELLLQYIVVGGMPAVVQDFVDKRDYSRVLKMQRNILDEYKQDMVKYADNKDKPLIIECFESIPKQLAKENRKFQYSKIQKGATASRYLGSIQWIEDVGIISRSYNLTVPELPLEGNAILDIFKVYMVDTGLFVAMLENGTQADILNGNLYTYKGAVFENLMADIMSKKGEKLYYYHKDSGLEIDFVTRYNSKCTLIEVKATTGNTKSSKTILNNPEKYHVEKCLKFGDYNIGDGEKILTLPMYLAPFVL